MNQFRLACSLAISLIPAAALSQERVDLQAIHRIKSEAIERSQVMDNLFYLTDVHGPRLTNSPAHLAAARWAVERLKSLGIADAQLEPWGRFGRGWSYSRLSIHMIEPIETPLVAAPMAWCSGTSGPVTGETFLAPFEEKEERDVARLAEKFKN